MPEMDGYETMRAIRENAEVQDAADHRAHREGDEGRPREVHRGGCVRLHHQAGRHRAAAVPDARVAVPVKTQDPCELRRYAADRTSRELERIEIELLLEGIYRHYGFDFRAYAYASLRRRLWKRIEAEGLATISALQDGSCTIRP